MEFDLKSATLATLAVIGAVNALEIFRPGVDSRIKFVTALVVAVVVSYVPVELANDLAERLKNGILLAVASSGVYKLAKIV